MLAVPAYKVTYTGHDITADVAKDLMSISFSDKLGSASDEITIALDDAKWLDAWYPKKGDRLDAELGDSRGSIVAGTYEIDQLDGAGPPDTLTIRALAAGPTKGWRTNHARTHKNKTLRQIAEDYARRNGFTLSGTIEDVTIDRAIQNNESDLRFLARLAEEYGYIFSIKTDKMVFTDVFALEAERAILTLEKSDIGRWSHSDRLVGVYSACEVSYHVPKTKKTERHTVKATDVTITSGDTLKIKVRASNAQQAQLKAKAALHKANAHHKTVRIDMEGNRKILAGVNITLGSTFGAVAGKYHVTSADHAVTRGASYGLSFEAKQV